MARKEFVISEVPPELTVPAAGTRRGRGEERRTAARGLSQLCRSSALALTVIDVIETAKSGMARRKSATSIRLSSTDKPTLWLDSDRQSNEYDARTHYVAGEKIKFAEEELRAPDSETKKNCLLSVYYAIRGEDSAIVDELSRIPRDARSLFALGRNHSICVIAQTGETQFS